MSYKKIVIISASLVIIAGIVAVLVATGEKSIIGDILKSETVLVDQAALDSLPKKDNSTAHTDRLSEKIIPPTNSWLSGMVLQSTPLPVFPMPLSFLAKDTGFEIGLPTISSTATVISGGHTPDLAVSIDGSTGFKLNRYDKVSATLAYTVHDKTTGTLTVAQGSPYVFYRAIESSDLTVNNVGKITGNATNTYVRYSQAGRDYVIYADKGASINQTGATATIDAPKGSLVTTYALSDTGKDTLREFAGNELTSVNISNAIVADNSTTTFEYVTENNKPTLFSAMNYTTVTNNSPSVAQYDSIYGPMQAHSGTKFTTTVNAVKPSNALDLSKVSASHKQQLIDTLNDDVAKTKVTATDSYFAGKQLARAATLLDISEQLGQSQTSAQLKTILRTEFSKRLGSKYFYYDTKLKGIAAQTKAFGSEDFNDHHFHYGYFIYAASIFGKYDTDFLNQNEKQINLLVADIASYAETKDFPLQRTYDPYSAHSWAAGLSPFADGNNQESSSEAINAWNGVAQWAQLTSNNQLYESAVWMLSNESATAKSAWRSVDTRANYLNNYTSPLVSLSFGGKRTYATFFSDESNTKLGIQLLPLSPMMMNMKSDGDINKRLVDAAIKDDNFNVALGDYILMYLALGNSEKASRLLALQTDSFIDDGNSRTYMQAWIYLLSGK